jgi:hypothetical protein
MYELTVRSYHGDADKEEESVLQFKPNAKDMEQLHVTLEILEAYQAAHRPYIITTGDWEQFIHEQGINTECIQYISDWMADILAWDVTSNGDYLTTFDGYTLAFYDVHGVKRYVTVGYTNGTN